MNKVKKCLARGIEELSEILNEEDFPVVVSLLEEEVKFLTGVEMERENHSSFFCNGRIYSMYKDFSDCEGSKYYTLKIYGKENQEEIKKVVERLIKADQRSLYGIETVAETSLEGTDELIKSIKMAELPVFIHLTKEELESITETKDTTHIASTDLKIMADQTFPMVYAKVLDLDNCYQLMTAFVDTNISLGYMGNNIRTAEGKNQKIRAIVNDGTNLNYFLENGNMRNFGEKILTTVRESRAKIKEIGSQH